MTHFIKPILQFAKEVVSYVAQEMEVVYVSNLHLNDVPLLLDDHKAVIDRLLDREKNEHRNSLLRELTENASYSLDLQFDTVVSNLENKFEGLQWNIERLLHHCTNIALLGVFADRTNYPGGMYNAIRPMAKFLICLYISPNVHESIRRIFQIPSEEGIPSVQRT